MRADALLLVVILFAAGAIARAAEGDPATVNVTVSATVLNPVDSRLFGQFLERPSWGETGPEAAFDPATHAPCGPTSCRFSSACAYR